MTSLDWSCYFCTFKTKEIDQLKEHVNSKHNTDSENSNISTKTKTKTNSQNETKSKAVQRSSNKFLQHSVVLDGKSFKTNHLKSSKPKPKPMKENRNNVSTIQDELPPIFNVKFENIFNTTTLFDNARSSFEDVVELDQEITNRSKLQKALLKVKKGRVSKAKVKSFEKIQIKEQTWKEISKTIDLNFDDIFKSQVEDEYSFSQISSHDDQTVNSSLSFIKEEIVQESDFKILNVSGNYNSSDSEIPQRSLNCKKKQQLNRFKLDQKLKSSKSETHQKKQKENNLPNAIKVELDHSSAVKSTELSKCQTLLSEKSKISSFFDFSVFCQHCSYVTDTQAGLKQHVSRRHPVQYRSGWTFKPVKEEPNQTGNPESILKMEADIVSVRNNNCIGNKPEIVTENCHISDLKKNRLKPEMKEDAKNSKLKCPRPLEPIILDKVTPIRIKLSKGPAAPKCSKGQTEKQTNLKLTKDLRQRLAFVRINGFNCNHCDFLATDIFLIKNHGKFEHQENKDIFLIKNHGKIEDQKNKLNRRIQLESNSSEYFTEEETSQIENISSDHESSPIKSKSLEKNKTQFLKFKQQKDEAILVEASTTGKQKIDKKNSNSSDEVSEKNQFTKKTKHFEKTQHSCNLCQRIFETERLLSSHKKSYHVVNDIKEKQSYRGTSIKHLKYFKNESNNEVSYQCSICQRNLATKYSLQRHTKTSHAKLKKSRKLKIKTEVFEKKSPSNEFKFLEEMKQNDFLKLFSLKTQNA